MVKSLNKIYKNGYFGDLMIFQNVRVFLFRDIFKELLALAIRMIYLKEIEIRITILALNIDLGAKNCFLELFWDENPKTLII